MREGRPAELARSLTDQSQITDAYLALAAEPRPRPPAPCRASSPPPLVSAVVPYHRRAEFVAETV